MAVLRQVLLPLEIAGVRELPFAPAEPSARGPAARRFEVAAQVVGMALSLTVWIDVVPGEPVPAAGGPASLRVEQAAAGGRLHYELLLAVPDKSGAPS